MRYLLIISLALSVLSFSMNFNDLSLFSYNLGSIYSLVISFGELNGMGLGLKGKDFELGFSTGDGALLYTIFKNHTKFLIFSSESNWFISSGSFIENFSYSSLSLEKTPMLGRFAIKMALLPKCEKTDEACIEKRKKVENYLNILFDSSILYRKISSLDMGYSFGILKFPKIPAFGFYKTADNLLAGMGNTDGRGGWIIGISWNGHFGIGGMLSVRKKIFQTDIGILASKNNVNATVGFQIDLQGGKLFAVFSKNGFEFYIF